MTHASDREEWKKISEPTTQETNPQNINRLAQEPCDAIDLSTLPFKGRREQLPQNDCGP